MSIRTANITTILLAATLFNVANAADKPNILFAIADDWGWPHSGSHGDPVVKTTTFDRIAAEGVLFEQAYVSSPSCTPSRNAILTGQYHWRLGPGANLHSNLTPGTATYPQLLKDAGYHVGRWRKSYGPGTLEGWDGVHPAGDEYKQGFDRFLETRPNDKPFCFWLGASDPHRGYELNSGAESGMNLDDIKLFACFPDTAKVRGDVADYYFEVQRFDSDVAKALKLLEAIGELDNTIVVMTGDHGMPFPRCKSNNYDTGVRVPLAIRWGKNVTRPGRVIKDFVSLTDIAPTFLEVAGLDIPESVTGKSLVSLLKSNREGIVEPEKRAFVLHGKERHVPSQEVHMGGYPVRAIRTHDFLYIRNFEPDRWPAGTPNYQKAAVKGCWLGDCDNGPTKAEIVDRKDMDDASLRLWELSFGKRPAEELYDCRKDPDQLSNVAGDPAYADIQSQLSGQLNDNLTRTGDPRVTGQDVPFDDYPYTGNGPLHPSVKKPKRKKKNRPDKKKAA